MPGVKGKGGIKGRSGRKSKAEEMGLASLLEKCWTKADREKCIKALAKQASVGEIEAVKLLMAYAFGKPKESKDITTNGNDIGFTLTINNAGSNEDI